MNTTENTSASEDVKITLPVKIQMLLWLKDKGAVFAVMGMVSWAMYSFIVEDRRERAEQVNEQNEQIKDLRRIVDDCASAKRDKLEMDVQAINIKMDKLLTRRNIN